MVISSQTACLFHHHARADGYEFSICRCYYQLMLLPDAVVSNLTTQLY